MWSWYSGFHTGFLRLLNQLKHIIIITKPLDSVSRILPPANKIGQLLIPNRRQSHHPSISFINPLRSQLFGLIGLSKSGRQNFPFTQLRLSILMFLFFPKSHQISVIFQTTSTGTRFCFSYM